MKMKKDVQDKEASREEITALHTKGDWRGAIDFLGSGEHKPLLLWLRPTFGLLTFMEDWLQKMSIENIVSLGCGTGLLEWLIQSAIPGTNVTGVEVDKDWWTCPYAPPVFHPLNYPEDPKVKDLLKQSSTALLFCYFNCEPAWKDYLAQFKGSLVIVCGPNVGSVIYSDPQPFQELTPEWTVSDGAKVGDTHDSIAIYSRVEIKS